MPRLDNAVALVTGAASGAGRAIAIEYAASGARVVVSDMDDDGGGETVRQIEEGGGEAMFIRADTSTPEASESLVRHAVEAYGRLDIACNHPDARGELAPVIDDPIAVWHRLVTVNISGVFYGMKAQIPTLIASGGGSIVNVGSILSGVGFRTASAYTTAIDVLLGLTVDGAREYREKGIRINAVGPAIVQTPVLPDLHQESERFGADPPTDRLREPRDIARLVAWLSSPEALAMTGAYYPVDANYLAP